jgi:hypothetical protein
MAELREKKAVTVYVLGAGASVHAGYPLADELGSRLHQWSETPGAHELSSGCVQEIAAIYGDLSNLEEILTDLADCPDNCAVAALSRHHRGMLLMYLRVAITELFRGYRDRSAPLFERLAGERIIAGDVVLTFNYDIVCERTLKVAGLWEIGDGYGFVLDGVSLPPSPVTVLKLHGSVNWLESAFDGNTGFFQGGPFALGPRPVIPSWELKLLGYSESVRDSKAGRIYGATPAMIMPTMNKQFYETTSGGRELEDFWASLWRSAELALKSADEVVIIGYGMAAADEKARALLTSGPRRDVNVKIFCGDNTPAIVRQFSEFGFRNIQSAGRGFFDDFLTK